MIQYLKKLWKALKQSTPVKDDKAFDLNIDEIISRFIYQKSDWNKQPVLKPKPKVFLPMTEDGQLETSVCRVSEISEQRIWSIANRARYPKPSLARADLTVSAVKDTELNVIAAPEVEADYPEHAVIVGWADDKDKQMLNAIRLAASSSLVLVSV